MNQEKSCGHIGWSGPYEYFKVDNSIFRAHKNGYICADGYRVGARFESTMAAWENGGRDIVDWDHE